MDRRGFIITGAAAASLSAAPLARGEPGDRVGDYYARLKSRLGDAGGGRFLPGVEADLMPEHNGFRAGQGLRLLVRHEGLDLAARAHAADLLHRRYFEHASPEGFTSVERVGLLARRFIGLAGENIVEVQGGPPSTAADLSELWRGSPGHRSNMLRPTYTHIGIGVVRSGDRTIGAVAFGQTFAQLAEPLAFRVGDGSALAGLLGASDPPVRGYALEPVGGGRQIGPFWLGDPPQAPERSGVYVLKPYMADAADRHRYIIIDGPIIEAG